MKYKYILLLLFVTRVLLALFGPSHPDVNNHIDWGIRFFEYGPKGFYAPESNVWNFTWPNQPPATMLVFAGVRKLYEALFSILWFVNTHVSLFPSVVMTFWANQGYTTLLKLPFILSDFGIAYFIYKVLKKENKKYAKIGSIVWLVNPVVWYNSSIWGQTDSLINLLVLAAFYFLFRNKTRFSILLISLSLFVKLSLAIFVPVYLILLLKKRHWKDTAFGIGISLCLVTFVSLLFSRGFPLTWLYHLYVDKVLGQQLHVITANAANFWAIFTGIHEAPQTLPFLGLTYQLWALIISGVLLVPIIINIVKKKPTEAGYYWALTLVAFIVWMFMTNMHERYLYPFFPYATILLFMKGRVIHIKTYAVISAISLVNMYNLWWKPEIPFLQANLEANDFLSIRLLAIGMLALFISIYRRYLIYEAK